MSNHSQHHDHDHGQQGGHQRHGHQHHHEEGLAETLDLDAVVLGPYLDQVTEWVADVAATEPHRIIDLGAGTGTGSLALARRFTTAEVLSVDRSPAMLERIAAAAASLDLGQRVSPVQADLDAGWPDLAGVDLAWAASSMHEFADTERVMGEVRGALNPGGLLVVIEMDTLPRFLPDDIGIGIPGLEVRCHEALEAAGWNHQQDWRAALERSGFEIAAQRTFALEVLSSTPETARYAGGFLGRIRSALAEVLEADDLAALDALLGDGPEALANRTDLMVRGSRTAWAARRP